MKLPIIPKSVLVLSALGVAGVYLFVTAPADLAAADAAEQVPVETLFRLLDAENASVRGLYTAEIVGPGLKAGLAFREDWKTQGVAAGPLPALLLRETSNRLQQRVPDLGLFLGSAYPIEVANRFQGEQVAAFTKVSAERAPQFFLDASTHRYTAMFPDVAVADPCVKCHNEHTKSPKHDWQKGDVMGAVTWSFPRPRVSTAELLEILAHYRAAAAEAYASYLKKTESFDDAKRPQLGAQWPADGLFLPDEVTFRQRVEATNSVSSLNLLMQTQNKKAPVTASAAGVKAP
jgi:hypothetical protein